jgi:HPt (histidine-containing phosphotransfer) domain-containing protein
MISLTSIAEERGIDEEFALEFLHEFYDYTANSDFPALRRALEAGDLTATSQRAHSIKGAAHNLMLDDMAMVAEMIVSRCRTGDVSELSNLADSLAKHMKALEDFLKTMK